MGEGNCAEDRRQGAEIGTSARFAGDGVSAARLAGVAADSPGTDAHVLAGGAVARAAESGARGGASLRDEPGFDRSAVPPGDSRRWHACRLPLGSLAQGTIAHERTCG